MILSKIDTLFRKVGLQIFEKYLNYTFAMVALFVGIITYSSIGFWYDEFHTYYAAKYFFSSYILNDIHPPLYFFFMKIWTMLFGFSELSIRFPSLIFFSINLNYYYLLINKLFHKKVAILSSILYIFLPYNLYYSHEGRMYSLFNMLVVLSFYFFVLFYEKNDSRYLKHYLVFTILMVYTHYIGFFILFSQIIYLIYIKKFEFRINLILFYLIIPVFIKAFYNFFKSNNHLPYHELTFNFFYPLVNMFGGSNLNNMFIDKLTVVSIFCLLSILLFLFSYRSGVSHYFFWLFFLIFPLGLILVVSYFIPLVSVYRIQYVSFFAIFYLGCVSYGIFSIRTNFKYVLAFIICIFFVFSTFQYSQFDSKIYNQEWYILEDMDFTDSDVVYVYPWLVKSIVEYYNPGAVGIVIVNETSFDGKHFLVIKGDINNFEISTSDYILKHSGTFNVLEYNLN